ncbi:ABC transporter permease subunit [Heyndrickxia acidicola]|uniref:ABC transporter permease subunit n=1 Tax=Heyndrickxia acidicola TaxID=209389 RepID=A0ABU6MDX8_9BACI|nr:ABC transporter permease subunit [Heyndrickxia acidicola]MED1202853.1 ABC transporter permease subunit [Heyndrickxia acidicola]
MRKLFELITRFILSCIGIILTGGLPGLLGDLNQGGLNWKGYAEALYEIFHGILHPKHLIYFYMGFEKPLFPNLFGLIGYSLTILVSAFFLAAAAALLLTFFIVKLRHRLKRFIKFIFYILESIPDLFIIALGELFVIFIYQKTGVLLAGLAEIGPQKVYLFPIICLSILPAIQLFRLCMIIFEDELDKEYVLLAASIGIKKSGIFVFHVFRNAIVHVFFQSKSTVWFMLSNLFVLEVLFNMSGIMTFLLQNLNPQIFTISLIVFFLPIFLFYSLGEWILEKKVTGGETSL